MVGLRSLGEIISIYQFQQTIAKTIDWYIENTQWSERVLDGSYQVQRLGIAKG